MIGFLLTICFVVLVVAGITYARKVGADYALLGQNLNRRLDALLAKLDK